MRSAYVGLVLFPALTATAQTPESTSNRLEEVVVTGRKIEHYLIQTQQVKPSELEALYLEIVRADEAKVS